MPVETGGGVRLITPKREAARIAQEEADASGEPRVLWRLNWYGAACKHPHGQYSYAVGPTDFQPPEADVNEWIRRLKGWRHESSKPMWENLGIVWPLRKQETLENLLGEGG